MGIFLKPAGIGPNTLVSICFHVEADGYQKQWEVNAERVEVAGGSLIQLFLEHPMMTNEMRTTLYSTKVRSLALLGADIWGWRRAYRLDKSDAKSLRILTRAHTRTKLEAMLWLVGLYPIWVLAAVQAFKFLISILEHGDVMEKAAWEQWKQCCRLHDKGWAFDMVSFFKRIDLLDQMGGRDNVLNWTAPQARHWFQIFRERCNNIAEQDMLRTLRSGKYRFLAHAIPTFEAPRPIALSLGMLCGRSLNNFLLSSHLLEVETGRYIRQQREQRFCQACKRSLGLRVLGDEQHALSSCVRAAEQRQLSFAKILSLFPGDSLRHIQHNSLFNMLNSLNSLSTNQQNLAWKLVAKNTLAVQQSIRSELGTQDRIPNIWKQCMKNILLKSVTKAAEKYFRKRLRRQQRNMPAQHFLLLLFPTIPMMMWRFWTEDLDDCHPCPTRCPFDSGFLLIFTPLFHQTSSVNYKELCAEVPLRARRAQDMKWNEMIEEKVLQEPPFIWEFVATPLGHTPVRVVVADQAVPKLVCPRQGQKTQQIRTESEPYPCWDCGVMTMNRFLWTLNTGPGGLRRHRMVVPESMRSHGRPLSLRHGNLGPLSGVCCGCSGFFGQVPVV